MLKQRRTTGYENQLVKTLKSLTRFNEEMSRELDEDESLQLIFRPDQTGAVVLMKGEVVATTVFEFENLDQMDAFFTASPLKRMMMVRGDAVTTGVAAALSAAAA